MMGQAAEKEQGIEYSIYTFDAPKGGKSANKWERRDTQTEMAAAMKTAESLFASGKYQKVEVKQKYFDKKQNRNIDMTLKVYEARKKKEINIVAITLFAVLCGGLAYAITYLLTK